MVRETELYDILHVSVEADENEIKRSYRRLALKYHPDKNTGDEAAADMFKKVSNAYEVLSDSEKRQIYDKYGKDGLERGIGESGGFHDATDIFSMFFGGGAARERGEPKPKDILHELDVKLDNLYNGATKKVIISRNRFCGTCEGSGLKPGCKRATCAQCHGRGALLRTQQVFPGLHHQVQVRCPACGGEGEVVQSADLCTGCRGRRVVREKTTLEVNIERGASKYEHFSFVGEGNQEPGMRLAGDVLIILNVRPHHIFHRLNDHLMMRCPITLQEALCGFEIPIVHLDNRELIIKASPGQVVHNDKAWSVYNEGMPLKGTGGLEKGKLFIHFEVEWPETLPKDQVDKIATALSAPESCKIGGQVVELKEYKGTGEYKGGKKERSSGAAWAGSKAAGAGRGRGAARGRKGSAEEDEYEDVTDDDADEQHFSGQQYFHSGQQGFPGTTQTVECAQQ